MSPAPRPSTRALPARVRHARHAALAVALALAFASSALVVAAGSAAAWEAGAFESSSERELVGLTNRTRREAGLRRLAVDPLLADVARWRSRDMAERGYFSHDIPGGGSVFDELARRGYCFQLAGENIGWNTWADDEATAGIHAMFLDSPGHRRNVVGATWDVIGIGAYMGSDGRKVWTVMFADACGAVQRADIATAEASTAPSPIAARLRATPASPAELGAAAVGREPDGSTTLLEALDRITVLVVDLLGRALAVGTGAVSAR